MRIIKDSEIAAMSEPLDRARAHGANADEYWRRAGIAMWAAIACAIIAVIAVIAGVVAAVLS